jgi:hypothetical protein
MNGFVKELNFVLENLWVIVAHTVENLVALVKYEGVRGVPDLKQMRLLLHKEAIVHENIATKEVEKVSGGFLLQPSSQQEQERAKEHRGGLIGQQSPLDLFLKLSLILVEHLISRRYSQEEKFDGV